MLFMHQSVYLKLVYNQLFKFSESIRIFVVIYWI